MHQHVTTVFNLLGSSSYVHFDLDAVTNNIEVMKKHYPEADIIGVVKGNAYGHGAVPVSRHLKSLGVPRLAVATIDEARQLRDAGVDGPIQVFGNTAAWQMPLCLFYELLPSVCTEEAIIGMSEAISNNTRGDTWRSRDNSNVSIVDVPHGKVGNEKTQRLSRIPPVGSIVIKLDTGMWRNGCVPEDLPRLVKLCKQSGVPLDGVFTHFAESVEEETFTDEQLETMRRAVKIAGVEHLNIHAANTGALLRGIATDMPLIRPGKGVYGLPPFNCAKQMEKFGFQTTLEVKTTPTLCKRVPKGSTIGYGRTYTAEEDQWVSVLPMGFCDGYHRSLGNKGHVVREATGELCPVVGTVSMDCIEVRTSSPTKPGEVFQLITKGYDPVTSLDGFQRMAATTASDIVIRQSMRVPRIYTLKGKLHCVYKFNVPMELPQEVVPELERLLFK